MHASADSKIIPAEKSPPVEAPCAKPHPRTSAASTADERSGHIFAEVALRRKQHKHNAVEFVDHTRRAYAFIHSFARSLANARTHARVYVYVRLVFARTYAYRGKDSMQLSARRDIGLRGGQKISVDKADKWINERFLTW